MCLGLVHMRQATANGGHRLLRWFSHTSVLASVTILSAAAVLKEMLMLHEATSPSTCARLRSSSAENMLQVLAKLLASLRGQKHMNHGHQNSLLVG